MSSVETSAPTVDTSDELVVFHRALAELCRADMPLPQAFRLLQARVDLEDFQDLPTEAILRGLFAAAAETGPDLHQVLEGLAEPERRRLTAINVGDTGRGGIQEAVAAYFELRSRRLEQEVRRLRRRMRGVPEEEGDRLLMQIREITRELQDMRAQTIDMSQHFQ